MAGAVRDHRLVTGSEKDQNLEQTPELETRKQVPVDPGRHFPVTCVPYNRRRVRHRTVDRVRNSKTENQTLFLKNVDPPIEGETDPRANPKANFQKIPECQRQNPQMLFSAIRFTEIKARLMDNPNIR